MQAPLPASDLYALESVPDAGRSVVAKCKIAAGTLLLSTSPPLSPIAHTIFRIYRREVCAWCFIYDRGRTLSYRDLLISAGVVFCSRQCAQKWLEQVGPVGLKAYQELEMRDRRCSKSKPFQDSMPDADDSQHVPSNEEVLDMLRSFHIFGENAKAARLKHVDARDKKKTLRVLSSERPGLDPDNLRLLLSGVIHNRDLNATKQCEAAEALDPATVLAEKLARTNVDQTPVAGDALVPPSLMALEGDSQVYKTQDALSEMIGGYTELLARLPLELLASVSPFLCHEILSRASHNAFSIRPPGFTDGGQSGEYFGWGVWPEASFFNHSCEPTVSKAREGRIWHFTAARDLEPGEHLCITYLGGDEQDLDVRERRDRLREHWHFECQCSRCKVEESTAQEKALS